MSWQTRAGILLVVTALVSVLTACSTEQARTTPDVAPVPERVGWASGNPGEPIDLDYEARAGQVVQVFVQPLPQQRCPLDFTLTSPSGKTVDLTTHDPMRRLDEDGTWRWTFVPCADEEGVFSLKGTPTRDHELRVDGPAVRLAQRGTWTDAATFDVPTQGRAILLGSFSAIVGPDGARVHALTNSGGLTFENGRLESAFTTPAVQDPSASPTYTVLGWSAGSDVRLVRPRQVSGRADGKPIELDPGSADLTGGYDVAFSVDHDTWLTALTSGWQAAAAPGDQTGTGTPERPTIKIVPVTGSKDVARRGGGIGGLWHAPPGDYVAQVTPQDLSDDGSLRLQPLVPTRITGPGRYPLTSSADGMPALALFDVDRRLPVRVAGGPHRRRPWLLSWHTDTPPPPCVSVLSCTAAREVPSIPMSPTARQVGWKPALDGQGYLSLSGQGSRTVTVIVGQH